MTTRMTKVSLITNLLMAVVIGAHIAGMVYFRMTPPRQHAWWANDQ